MHIITHSFDHNEMLVEQLLAQFPLDVAMYKAIGCNNIEEYKNSGDAHVAVLKHEGLEYPCWSRVRKSVYVASSGHAFATDCGVGTRFNSRMTLRVTPSGRAPKARP